MELKDIRKSYGENLVLDSINLKFAKQRIYCMIGYNGYGKSTIAKIACGEQTFDSGMILFNGREYRKWTTEQAVSLGVIMLSEQSSLFQNQTVYQNMQYSLIRQDRYRRHFLFVQKRKLMEEIKNFVKEYDLSFSPETQVNELSYSEQMMAELLRARLLCPKVLLVDEIDIAMDHKYKDVLKNILLEMKRDGTSILYISHKLDMIMALADVIGIIQNYRLTEIKREHIGSTEDILKILLNSSAERVPKLNRHRGVLLLSARYAEQRKFYSLKLYEGEILGITGTGKNDSSLIYEMLFNQKGNHTELCFGSKPVYELKPQNALQNGIVFISTEFMRLTTYWGKSVCYNMLPYNVVKKIRSEKRQKELCQRYINILGIQGTPEDMIETLSLGNQRKTFIARCFLSCGDIYVFENPTDSIDGISKIDIYNIINELKIQGKGIIVISNDLKEIMGISDRIVIVQEKRIIGELENDQFAPKRMEQVLEQTTE